MALVKPNLIKPTIFEDEDVWGHKLNHNITEQDKFNEAIVKGGIGGGGTVRLGTNGGILINGYEVTIDIDGEVHEYTTVELNGPNGGIVINGVELTVVADV